ncbi:hypothetical protein RGQ15_07220 [Paracoccus sp. MBLB3053]|uniref:Uncharacterized protein n=1 Tax=Paracoccus aurantius TaxID=3073814 RepID=A0ABU2HRY1_9RHOB|nr:hypothetical protein [Paracoccus sp. MBLB3053]MDS9467364.1 hypothetical protein [Paracoccus sp. MBLB3053]
MRDTSIIFVLDPPKLIADGILLVASIRRHMPDTEVIGYCPAEKAEMIPPQVSEFFKANNAEIRYFEATGKFDPPYPHGNKILASAEPRSTGFTLFLDTDIVLWQAFEPSEILHDNTVSAAPEGVMTWGKSSESWPRVYKMFDMEPPEETINLARSGRPSKPYFNAGVVGFPNVAVAGFPNFGALWLDTAQKIGANPKVEESRPWLDQISMPVAIARAGWAYLLLENRWNLSLSRKEAEPDMPGKKLERIDETVSRMNGEDAVILHYHSPKFLYGTRYEGYFEDLTREFTCFSKLEEMSPNNLTSFLAQKQATDKIKEIKAIPKEERTAEQKAEATESKRQRRDLRQAVRNPDFASWPDSILPAQG